MTTKKLTDAAHLFILAALGLVGIVVLLALHDPVPPILSAVVFAAIAGGAGLGLPSALPSSSSTTTTTVAAPTVPLTVTTTDGTAPTADPGA